MNTFASACKRFDIIPHQQAILDVRSELPLRLKTSGTVATAEIEIDGLPDRLSAHSRINDPDNVRGGENFVGQAIENFEFQDSTGSAGNVTSGNTHAEYTILDNIADQLGDNPNATGRVDLLVELPPCTESCEGSTWVIAQFRQKYPNIDLNVEYNHGLRLRP